MPSKNSIKLYVENGYYHVYNRGVEKRTIFQDDQDYQVFLSYLKECLLPITKITGKKPQGGSLRLQPWEIKRKKNYSDSIQLLAYALMPNHFHLLIKQKSKTSMESFMRSLMTKYSMYFNKKYIRVGKLFQGHYKAAIIETDEYLLYVSKYIHLNPLEINNSIVKAYSSYADYLGLRNTKWISKEEILNYFPNNRLVEYINSYQKFVEQNNDEYKEIKHLTLDS